MQPAVIADLILAVILAGFVLAGVKRGLILSLCGVVALIVGFVGANLLADTFTPTVAGWLQPVLEQRVQQTLGETLSGLAPTQTALTGAGDEMTGLFGALKETEAYQTYIRSVTESVSEGVEQAADTLAATVAEGLARSIARLILFYGGFVLIAMAWRFFSMGLDLVFKLPVLSWVNGLGGGLFGVVEGLLLVGAAVWLVCGVFHWIPDAVVAESRLLRLLLDADPLL